jgi:tRNA dimethylallyltransferase
MAVVGADSRQVYRGVDAATGKPTPAERAAVAHHLIDIVEPEDPYQAARFRADALAAIGQIGLAGRLPVVVGGTGLYVRALLRGLDPAPPRDPGLRRELTAIAAADGPRALWDRLATIAPAAARKLHPNDQVRVIRALEVARAGPGLASGPGRWREAPCPFTLCFVGLTRDRKQLFPALRARAVEMVGRGLLDEVRSLLARGDDEALPALRGIGYRHFVEVARGRATEAEAVGRMQQDTVAYARRQWTWFAREPGLQWLDVDRAGGVEGTAETIMKMVDAGGLIE